MASRLVNFRADPAMADAIEAAAERRLTTVSALVREAIVEKLQADEPASLDATFSRLAERGFTNGEAAAGLVRVAVANGQQEEAFDLIRTMLAAVAPAAAEAGMTIPEYLVQTRAALGAKALELDGAVSEGAAA